MKAQPYERIDGVDMYGIVGVLTEMYGADWRAHPPYDQQAWDLEGWCAEHNAHYYARPRDRFSTYEAVDEAKERGKTAVVVEDMS